MALCLYNKSLDVSVSGSCNDKLIDESISPKLNLDVPHYDHGHSHKHMHNHRHGHCHERSLSRDRRHRHDHRGHSFDRKHHRRHSRHGHCSHSLEFKHHYDSQSRHHYLKNEFNTNNSDSVKNGHDFSNTDFTVNYINAIIQLINLKINKTKNENGNSKSSGITDEQFKMILGECRFMAYSKSQKNFDNDSNTVIN